MKPMDLYYMTMTNYDDTFKNVHVVYDKDNLVQTLGEVISIEWKDADSVIAETEKYPHVTFFFSGGRVAWSLKAKHELWFFSKSGYHDLMPEMSAFGLRIKSLS
ncbi:MAG: hypothetical protein R2809_12325 [Flavobacteriales bacterium]